MAGDWIPMRLDIADDPAVISISGAVGLDEDAVVGKLHRLWAWANRHLSSGVATGITEAWVDRYVGTAGFAAALIVSGWLRTRSDGIEFTNFDRWNSEGAKKRIVKTQQKQRQRMSPSGGDKMATETRPEKRRVEREPPSEVLAGTPAKGKTKTRKPPREPKPRPRNPLFDAIADITGSDPGASGSHVGRVCSALGQADPPYTPDEVRDFAARFTALCPWSNGRRPTLGEVEKYIGLLRNGQGQPQRPPPRGIETPAQRMMNNLIDAMEDDGHE